MCLAKSKKYIASYRFYRVLSILCSGISKPTPEDFFDAYVNHHADAGIPVRKDAVIELMLKHAVFMFEEAKRYVNIQSWKDFARTKDLDIDEESDVEMDAPESSRVVRPGPSSPATLTLSPRRKRVRPLTSNANTLPNHPHTHS
jgi:hypothetical protein